MWLDIQCDVKAGTSNFQRGRRYEIADIVRAGILAVFCGLRQWPTIDIECRPLDGSGMTMNSKGQTTHHWGSPFS